MDDDFDLTPGGLTMNGHPSQNEPAASRPDPVLLAIRVLTLAVALAAMIVSFNAVHTMNETQNLIDKYTRADYEPVDWWYDHDDNASDAENLARACKEFDRRVEAGIWPTDLYGPFGCPAPATDSAPKKADKGTSLDRSLNTDKWLDIDRSLNTDKWLDVDAL